MTPYDPLKDGFDSWALAIAEIRRRGVMEGKYEPINDDERALLKEAGR
jgi:hypothetical protein